MITRWNLLTFPHLHCSFRRCQQKKFMHGCMMVISIWILYQVQPCSELNLAKNWIFFKLELRARLDKIQNWYDRHATLHDFCCWQRLKLSLQYEWGKVKRFQRVIIVTFYVGGVKNRASKFAPPPKATHITWYVYWQTLWKPGGYHDDLLL